MGIVTATNFKKAMIDIANRIEEGDSFEGTISYSRLTSGLERGELEVSVAVRVGNLEGQGGMFIIEASKLNEDGSIKGREAVTARDQAQMDEYYRAHHSEDPKQKDWDSKC